MTPSDYVRLCKLTELALQREKEQAPAGFTCDDVLFLVRLLYAYWDSITDRPIPESPAVTQAVEDAKRLLQLPTPQKPPPSPTKP